MQRQKMKRIFFKSAGRFLPFKQKIEKALNVQISIEPENILIEGEAIDEDIAADVLDALYLGFDIKTALMLKEEGMLFEKINIKDYVRESRVKTAKARMIGKEGRVKIVLSQLTDCAISIKDNNIGIIGRSEDVEIALQAITSLIRGKPHSKVYTSLERIRRERRFEEKEDLGLRKSFFKKKSKKY